MMTGKLNQQMLNKYVFEPLAELPARPEVKLRPGPGKDCAALELSGRILVSADPITAATHEIGYLAVHVNANDIAAGGGEPIGIMLTVLLPETADEHVIKDIMHGARRAAAELGIDILGGHTEVTDAVTRPVVSAAIIGRAVREMTGGRHGDELVMTKYAGLEGTAIIANERPERVKALGAGVYERAVSLSAQLSVVGEAAIAAEYGATAMHDITEGGVLGACYELAASAGTGVELYLDSVPVLDETKAVCAEFGIDPYALISSGCLLIAIAARDGRTLADRLNAQGIPAAVIGRLTGGDRVYYRGDTRLVLPEPPTDEIYKVFSSGPA